ncbi:unnamed protein product [Neospora caninum Liverpool]|uniref:BT1 family protein n=1 Tax=Neospora caninum (strain Liverpool) TaxID=572307 RepID=F0VFM2_NEOCL|nr:uncharacterized protein NCLIV_023045 [Neospora caninum Liverpool]CBZ52516.1 unnamed protein product [Neospora caninum Liverpool]CEL66493.1 TPA: BT1 family protein [Neospora caninum Liverpool]|eukprot:XP_003882548.1 uncharacterized protein NCLIV_023045 [Neospora caninum Liverpool]
MSSLVAAQTSPERSPAPDVFPPVPSNPPFHRPDASLSSFSSSSSSSCSSRSCSSVDTVGQVCNCHPPVSSFVRDPVPSLPGSIASRGSSAASLLPAGSLCASPAREGSAEAAGGERRSCRQWILWFFSACLRVPRLIFSPAAVRWVVSVLVLPFSLCESVRKAVGSRFFLLLISVYFSVKGLVYSLSTAAMLPYFKGLGWNAATYQQATAVVFVPWGMKGLIGTLADALPLFGYRKKYYMLTSSVLGVGGVFGLCILPDDLAANRLWLVCLLLLLIQLQVATLDLMCEGKYSELMVELPEIGPAIVTFVNALISIGQATGKMVVGPVSDRLGTRPLFWLALPLASSVVIPICLNYLPEKKLDSADLQVLRRHLWAQKHVFVMGLALATASLGVAVISLFDSQQILIVYSLCAGVLLSLICCMALPRPIAFCNMYFFLDQLLHLNVSGALDFFYTATPACLPDGPHFDYTYYNTYTCIAGGAGGVVVLVLFLKVLPRYSFRHILTAACLVRLAASLVDYMLVSRLTTQLNLSDRAVYLVGDAVILVGAGALSYMVGVMLISKLCPKHVEATVYAILAGMGNMGSTISTLLGVAAIKEFHINTTTDEARPCDFSRMPQLISISNFILPSLCVPVCMTLLPNTAMNAPLPVVAGLEDAPEFSRPLFAHDEMQHGDAGGRGEEEGENETRRTRTVGNRQRLGGSSACDKGESEDADDRESNGEEGWRRRRTRRHRRKETEEGRRGCLDATNTGAGGVPREGWAGNEERRPRRSREKRITLDAAGQAEYDEKHRAFVPVAAKLAGTELVAVRCEGRNKWKRVSSGEAEGEEG